MARPATATTNTMAAVPVAARRLSPRKPHVRKTPRSWRTRMTTKPLQNKQAPAMNATLGPWVVAASTRCSAMVRAVPIRATQSGPVGAESFTVDLSRQRPVLVVTAESAHAPHLVGDDETEREQGDNEDRVLVRLFDGVVLKQIPHHQHSVRQYRQERCEPDQRDAEPQPGGCDQAR